jgi:ketosteroid isomerase-like protein
MATVHWTFTVRATGKTASMYMQHWFRFVDGKIVFFRGSEDSDQTARAFS